MPRHFEKFWEKSHSNRQARSRAIQNWIITVGKKLWRWGKRKEEQIGAGRRSKAIAVLCTVVSISPILSLLRTHNVSRYTTISYPLALPLPEKEIHLQGCWMSGKWKPENCTSSGCYYCCVKLNSSSWVIVGNKTRFWMKVHVVQYLKRGSVKWQTQFHFTTRHVLYFLANCNSA